MFCGVLLPLVPALVYATGSFQPAGSADPCGRGDVIHLAEIIENTDRFQVHLSEHFRITSDAPGEQLANMKEELEDTFSAVVRFHEKRLGTPSLPAERLDVIQFRKSTDYSRVASRLNPAHNTVPGFYHEPTHSVVLLDLTAAAAEEATKADSREAPRGESVEERMNRLVLRHETAHQVLFALGVHARGADNPLWLMEGLACEFESVHGGDSPGTTVNRPRLGDLRYALNLRSLSTHEENFDPREPFRNEALSPLRKLVSEDGVFQTENARTAVRYAQAWALVRYLVDRKEEAFQQYVKQVASRPPDREFTAQEDLDRFEACFGPLDVDFLRNWLQYVAELPMSRRAKADD